MEDSDKSMDWALKNGELDQIKDLIEKVLYFAFILLVNIDEW